jgi:hypothetical protein
MERWLDPAVTIPKLRCDSRTARSKSPSPSGRTWVKIAVTVPATIIFFTVARASIMRVGAYSNLA